MRLNQEVGFKSGGGTGIRTLGRLLTYAGFQDQCFQPLSHPSAEMFSVIYITENNAVLQIEEVKIWRRDRDSNPG